jgi:two-component system, LytTR family, sensor kinase
LTGSSTHDRLGSSSILRREAIEDLWGVQLGRRRWRWSFYAGGWLFVGILFVVPTVARAVARGDAVPWVRIVSDLASWGIWGLLLPPIWWLSRRFPWERDKLASWLPIHLAGGLLTSILFIVLLEIKEDLLAAVLGATLPRTGLSDYLYGGFELFLLPYFAVVAFVHALGTYQRYRGRALHTSRLETQLAQAHLEMLKMQLRPHFLFNTLNAISALMRRDVEAADRMIVLLSDLLRMSLDQDDRHQVSLQDELEFLNRYLAIEQIRFRDRLQVDIDVEPACLPAQVPRLILQPLVENSIRHGIAMRSAAGRIAVKGRRKGHRLELEVWDDGPGLPEGTVLREGVGLANTKARLDQIYGSEHRFELRNAEVGGLEVHLAIPFEVQPRLAARKGLP